MKDQVTIIIPFYLSFSSFILPGFPALGLAVTRGSGNAVLPTFEPAEKINAQDQANTSFAPGATTNGPMASSKPKKAEGRLSYQSSRFACRYIGSSRATIKNIWRIEIANGSSHRTTAVLEHGPIGKITAFFLLRPAG